MATAIPVSGQQALPLLSQEHTGTMADTPRRRAAGTRTTDSPAISVRGEGRELTSSHKNTKITTAKQPEKTGTYKKGHLTFKDKEGTMRW